MNKRVLCSIAMVLVASVIMLGVPSKPAQASVQKPVVIFYSPHADDEVLSMGMAIAEYVEKGYDVHVVLITHGYDSDAINVLNGKEFCRIHGKFHDPALEGYKPLTKEEFGAIRVNEFMKSTEDLGVPKSNIYVCNYPKDVVYPEQLKELMTSFEKQYPDSIQATTSYLDQHPFHRKVAQALLDLHQEGVIKNVQFYLSPGIWNKTEGESQTVYDPNLKDKVKNSLSEYKKWDPQHGEFAVGYHSVTLFFERVERHLYSKLLINKSLINKLFIHPTNIENRPVF